MYNNQQNTQSETSETKGVYTISDIDKFTIAKIEDAKTHYLGELSETDTVTACERLSDLLSNMQTMIEKYFTVEEIKTYTATIDKKKYTFYDLKAEIEDEYEDRDLMRLVAETEFSIFNHFTKQIGVEIPTTKHNPKKKLLDRLYSLVPNRDEKFYDSFKVGYAKFLKTDRYKNSMRNYAAYTMSEAPSFDLDVNALIIGAARSGKSTLFIQLARRIYAAKMGIPVGKADDKLINNGWVFNNIIYSKEQGLKPLKTCRNEVIGIDEGYLVGDKRQSLNEEQINYIKYTNFYASNNNIIFTLIQDLTDLDQRIYSKANLIFLIYARGKALLYARNKNFPIIKSTYDFEKFQKAPYLLGNEDMGLHHLRGLSSYVQDVSFNDLEGNLLYNSYLQNKKKYQDQGAG